MSNYCLVCGGTAYHQHFGRITCAACKVFFRRNAMKEDLENLCQKQCVINTYTRKKCKVCRLKKCFDVGMDKHKIGTRVKQMKTVDPCLSENQFPLLDSVDNCRLTTESSRPPKAESIFPDNISGNNFYITHHSPIKDYNMHQYNTEFLNDEMASQASILTQVLTIYDTLPGQYKQSTLYEKGMSTLQELTYSDLLTPLTDTYSNQYTNLSTSTLEMSSMTLELISACTRSYEKPMVQEVKAKPSLAATLNQFEGYIRKSVKFANYLSEFKTLSTKDQICLLKESLGEMIHTYMLSVFDPNSCSLYIRHRQPSDPEKVITTQTSLSAILMTDKGKILMDQFIALWNNYNQITQNNQITNMCVIACMLFTPKPGSVYQNAGKISQFYTKLKQLLHVLVKTNFHELLNFIMEMRVHTKMATNFVYEILPLSLSPFMETMILGDE